MTFAERLKAARRAKGITQAELARAAGIKGQSLIGNLEAGNQQSTTYVSRIARELGVSPIWLETGSGPKYLVAEPGPAGYHPNAQDESILLRAYRLASPDLRRSLLWQAQKILDDLDNPSPLTGTHPPECQ